MSRVRAGLGALLLSAASPEAQTALAQTNFNLADIAKSGARIAGVNVGTATHYCQMPPAIAFPDGLVDQYAARARRKFAADPNFDADFASGEADDLFGPLYRQLAASDPAKAESSRQEACHDMIASMQRDVARP